MKIKKVKIDATQILIDVEYTASWFHQKSLLFDIN